ncbi:MarR family winged helix-turn-helix transcriptional regulator [Lacticaseibacillus baoqingensis]|uniref:MarR family winged helix-turn-helix transcriptional regulator n=1 Tax=Lacticaseibacillus baoqingensis TaxID=2486013 RepID=A0ABW4E5Y7_9LACO|nr:MarR family winged helix-turn-helix transcriptional regulator [Lacticaseibacillus baoqingensis]
MADKTMRASLTFQQFIRLLPPTAAARPLPELNLLFWLANHEQAPTPSGLAAQWQVSRAAITKTLTPLVAAGLVSKQRDAADLRSFTIHLTAAGRAVVDNCAEAYLKPLTTLRAGLGKKRFRKLEKLLMAANACLSPKEPQ